MSFLSYIEWQAYADAFAFTGNTLRNTVNRAVNIGMRPALWNKFPTFNDDAIAAACEKMHDYVTDDKREAEGGFADAAAEYAHLFDGDAAAVDPCESTYCCATDEETAALRASIRALFEASGLELKNAENEREDHFGLEMLFVAALCDRLMAERDPEAQAAIEERLVAFINEHPLAWVGKLRASVAQEAPGGYFDCLLELAEALMRNLLAKL